MDDFIQLLHPRRSATSAKGRVGQTRAVDASVRLQYPAPKPPHHLLIDRSARQHQGVRNRIGLQQPRSQLDKHLPNGRFAAGNAARESNFQQEVVPQLP